MSRLTVVVTGASSGVGRATARAFAATGADVALIARGAAGLAAAAREVEEAGGRALVLPLDVADAEAVESAASRVEAELGPIDVWVNCAMTAVLAPVKETSATQFRRVTEVAYLGYVHGTLAALDRMLPRDRGVIVQVGSALAHRAIPLQATYCGAKHAIKGFTDALRCELLHDRSGVCTRPTSSSATPRTSRSSASSSIATSPSPSTHPAAEAAAAPSPARGAPRSGHCGRVQSDRCVGALTGSYDSPGELAYDPFANLSPTVVLRVEAGTGAHARARGSGHPALRGGQPLALGPVLAESTERNSR